MCLAKVYLIEFRGGTPTQLELQQPQPGGGRRTALDPVQVRAGAPTPNPALGLVSLSLSRRSPQTRVRGCANTRFFGMPRAPATQLASLSLLEQLEQVHNLLDPEGSAQRQQLTVLAHSRQSKKELQRQGDICQERTIRSEEHTQVYRS
jgi:hypothetical protein